MTRPRSHPARRHPRGFTLIELMASIAMVLLLILGVQQVFKIASDSVGAGQALSTAQRDNRSAQAVIYSDLKNAVTQDAPFLIINSTRVAAFRNKADMLSDRDFNPTATLAPTDLAVRTVDNDANNSEADARDQVSRTVVNNRNHRVDEIKFFARDIYRRQTGNDGVFMSDVASQEALITYGHIRQPHDPTDTTSLANARDPGIEHNDAKQTEAQNANNYFAQQWVLGRHVMLLRDPEPDGADFVIEDSAGARQAYVGRLATTVDPKRIDPIQENVTRITRDGRTNEGTYVLDNGRYDLMGASIPTLNGIIRAAIAARLPNEKKWFDDVSYRYAGYMYPTKPHTSEGLARTSTAFIPGCSQFIVEYAIDYTTQDPNTGAVTALTPDGTTDFVPIFNGAGNPVNRRVRWHGFPRNVDTSDDNDPTVPNRVRIQGATGAAAGATNILDVVPLRDIIIASGGTEQAPFEKTRVPTSNSPTSGSDRLPVKDNYAATDTRNVANDAQDTCAWGPSGTYRNLSGVVVPDPPMPRMIRFVIAIDDVQGRLNDPQFYEYVVELPI